MRQTYFYKNIFFYGTIFIFSEEIDRASKLWSKLGVPVAIAVVVCVILCIVCSWCRGNCDANDEERGHSGESSNARIRLVFNESKLEF